MSDEEAPAVTVREGHSNNPPADPTAEISRESVAAPTPDLPVTTLPSATSPTDTMRSAWQSLVWRTVSYWGVLLWTFIIGGEYVTGAGVPEVIAAFVCLVVLGARYRLLAKSRGHQETGRVVGGAFIALVVFLTLVSSAFGSSQASTYQGTSLFLLVLSVVLIVVAGRKIRKAEAKSELSPKLKTGWVGLAIWTGFALNTLLIAFALLGAM